MYFFGCLRTVAFFATFVILMAFYASLQITFNQLHSSGDTLQKISPVKVDSQLKSTNIMHFGWNIGKAFGRKRVYTATFIKNVFTHTLRDLGISTIERKMSHTESECMIKLDNKIV